MSVKACAVGFQTALPCGYFDQVNVVNLKGLLNAELAPNFISWGVIADYFVSDGF